MYLVIGKSWPVGFVLLLIKSIDWPRKRTPQQSEGWTYGKNHSSLYFLSLGVGNIFLFFFMFRLSNWIKHKHLWETNKEERRREMKCGNLPSNSPATRRIFICVLAFLWYFSSRSGLSVFQVTITLAIFPVKRVHSVETYSWNSIIPRGSEWGREWLKQVCEGLPSQ